MAVIKRFRKKKGRNGIVSYKQNTQNKGIQHIRDVKFVFPKDLVATNVLPGSSFFTSWLPKVLELQGKQSAF